MADAEDHEGLTAIREEPKPAQTRGQDSCPARVSSNHEENPTHFLNPFNRRRTQESPIVPRMRQDTACVIRFNTAPC